MQITTTDLYARIKYGKDSFTHPLNTISYVINDSYDGVTLFRNNEAIGTGPFGEVSVNGETLNAANAESLLSQLFGCCSGGGTGTQVQTDYLEENTASPAYLKNRPVSKIQEGDNFPQAIVPGHVCIVYDAQNNQKFVYEWDGFIWTMTGADYNLVFDSTDTNSDYESLGYFTKRAGKTYYTYIDPNTDNKEFSITATQVHKITNEYKVNSLNLNIDKDYDTLSFDGLNIGTYYISKLSSDSTSPSINKLEIKNGINLNYLYAYEYFIKEVVIENMQANNDHGSTIGSNINIKSDNITLLNNDFLGTISFDLHYMTSTSPSRKINISGNTFDPMHGHVSMYSDDVEYEYEVTIMNNEKLRYVDISSFNLIKTLNINLDPSSLEHFNLSSCTLSTEALQNVVTALTVTPFSNTVEFSYYGSSPALSQAQLDALAANNVNVQI
ncbi:MAG: hypothetical protein E6772_07725 [Dysgonomonas sp.]|nr:hypothetical protein [Dysgonomonas sp.]